MDDLESLPAISLEHLHPHLSKYLAQALLNVNSFANDADRKLCLIEDLLQKLESEVELLLMQTDEISSSPKMPSYLDDEKIVDDLVNEDVEEVVSNALEVEPVEESIDGISVREHPKYKKFFKLLSLGAPAAQLKQTMSIEGLNASYLDSPDLVIEHNQE